ncbi:hypothetical protein [Burkholderia gladioli]|uniref:hypothetical protein n=1 Tax=Burkholderia gladioli TaxID=28095 RepID=UPI000B17F586|nr:hypothetical protein [Burkholderia gladioli]
MSSTGAAVAARGISPARGLALRRSMRGLRGAADASRVPAAIHLITPEKRLNKSLQQLVRGSSRLMVSRANRISRAARHDSLFTLSEDTP